MIVRTACCALLAATCASAAAAQEAVDSAFARAAAQPVIELPHVRIDVPAAPAPRPPAVVTPRVQAIIAEERDSVVLVRVQAPEGTTFRVSEPYFHADMVRLHFDIDAPRAPRARLPVVAAADGLLIGVTSGDDALATSLRVDLRAIGGYDVHTDEGWIVLTITPPTPQPAAAPVIPVPAFTASPAPEAPAATTHTNMTRAAVSDAVRGVLARMPAPDVRTIMAVAALLLASLATVMLFRRSRTAADRRPIAQACTLAASGLSADEVAARTRTSREAVRLAVRCGPGSSGRTTADNAAASGRNFRPRPGAEPSSPRLAAVRR